MKRCINCKQYRKLQIDEYIGFCRKYGFAVKDTLSGCEERKVAVKPLVKTTGKM